ncbi:MAG: GNAT family N-acetyltransferase [Acidobacteria bacterium]|nr:GNAT family N-acetyltransferase [Acidobacteriota bacterium]
MIVEPVVLEGEVVRLEPMAVGHLDGLWEAGRDESLWRLIPTNVASIDDMRKYVESAIADRDRGVALPFVTVERSSGKVIGSTRLGNIDAANLRCEIGWTWITPAFQRTAVNTEAKLLMLTHAFETWKCIRVELKTDALNERSRAAIKRLGATEEGIFRKHMICDTGRFRDSVYFSIIDTEWPTVKEDLEKRLTSR